MATSFATRNVDERTGNEDTGEPIVSRSWAIAAGLLAAGLGTIGAAYWDTLASTIRVWGESETFNHCFLILPISAYLIWRRWPEVASLSPSPWAWGLVPVTLSALFWVVGNTAGVLLAEQLAVLTMVQALVLTVIGPRLFRALLFPLLFLYFAIPIGTSLILPLQHVTAQILIPILRLTGIPVFLDGLFLSIPSGNFEVAEACSGVRYLISSIALGFLAANLLLETLWRRIALIALCVLIPIIANGLRAYGIVMIAHLSSYEYAVGTDHLIYGWIFFSVVTLCLLGAAVALRTGEPAVERSEPPSAGQIRPIELGRAGAYLILVAAASASGWVFQWGVTPDLSSLPKAVTPLTLHVSAPWRRSESTRAEWHPVIPGASSELRGTYALESREVELFAAYFWYQHQGAEVISESNRHFDRKVWRPANTGRTEVTIGDSVFSVNQVLLRSPHGDRILWYWYWIGGRFTADRYVAKLLELRAKLLERSGDAAYLALSTAVEGSVDEAAARLQEFLGHADGLGASLAKATHDIESRRD